MDMSPIFMVFTEQEVGAVLVYWFIAMAVTPIVVWLIGKAITGSGARTAKKTVRSFANGMAQKRT
jgi:multisubunit Na+/H+ antiporter MnhG subunit